MKKLIIISIFVFCIVNLIVAQQKFNVQNGTKAEFYDDLETAIQKAVSGDTIYLPGHLVQVQNDLIIDKKLALIGAGCDVDSIGGLQVTEIQKVNAGDATINFYNGSDGSLLTGCIVGGIQLGNKTEVNTPQSIQNITIWRNRIGAINLGADNVSNLMNKITISENFVYYINGYNASNCVVNNNLVYGFYNYNGMASLLSFTNSLISNNVLGNDIMAVTDCIVENNFASGIDMYSSNSIFNNNAFQRSYTFPYVNANGSNNLVNQDPSKTFVSYYGFNSPNDMVIRSDSPCKNAGTDGTDIGIFGGSSPYKAGAVPFNPHIDKTNIAGQLDANGNLRVNIQVSAQTR